MRGPYESGSDTVAVVFSMEFQRFMRRSSDSSYTIHTFDVRFPKNLSPYPLFIPSRIGVTFLLIVGGCEKQRSTPKVKEPLNKRSSEVREPF